MYKPRFSFKNIILSPNSLNASTSSYSNTISPPRLEFKKVLLVSKLSFYEHERSRYHNLNEKEFQHELRSRGSDYDRLAQCFYLQKSFEAKVVDILTKAGLEVRCANRVNYKDELTEWADVVMPTGGDGTFLLAASRVRNSNKPVVGFNSDPVRSEGHLCLPKYYSEKPEEAIQRLQAGKFKWLLRSRIRTTLYGQKGKVIPVHMHTAERSYNYEANMQSEKEFSKVASVSSGQVIPFLALNEVFAGECMSARVSYLEMWLNGSDQATNMKCSGLCVSTGTGSTSWHLSINRLPIQSVAELLRLLDIEATGAKDSLATVLADIYNKNLVFSADDKRLGYTIRDMISAGVWPQPKGIKSRGFASQIKVRSKCIDACLVIDGGITVPFNDGSIAVLEIRPEDSLRTVVFD